MTWVDLQIGDNFDRFGINGKVIERIKSLDGKFVKTIKIEKEDKETVYISIGGK